MINLKTLYFLGTWILGIMTLGNIISMKLSWEVLNIGSKMSSIAGACFNLVFTLFFLGLYIAECKKPKIIDSPELDNLLKKFEVKGGSKK